MTFTIKLAGVPIGVHSLYDEVYELCADYLTEEPPAFTVSVSEADIDDERKKSAREAALEGRPIELFPAPYLETLAVYRKIAGEMLRFDTFLLHGSAVAVDGAAYLFTAPSGVGKTTHTRLWLENIPGAYVVNGDKPLIRCADGVVSVCGTPWSGKEGTNRNTTVPLKGIVFLERGEANRIERADFSDVLPQFLSQTYRPKEAQLRRKTMLLVRTVSTAVPFYRLQCNMLPDAAVTAYQGLTMPSDT